MNQIVWFISDWKKRFKLLRLSYGNSWVIITKPQKQRQSHWVWTQRWHLEQLWQLIFFSVDCSMICWHLHNFAHFAASSFIFFTLSPSVSQRTFSRSKTLSCISFIAPSSSASRSLDCSSSVCRPLTNCSVYWRQTTAAFRQVCSEMLTSLYLDAD